MREWFEGLAGPQFATAVIWTLAALILLVLVLLVVRLVRGMTFGTFVAGGRNRKTRLAVMDATAVDSHRRLVLVRRDDVEHLILIGGPTDVVVEREIRVGQPRRPALTADGGQEQPPPPAPRQTTMPPAAHPQPVQRQAPPAHHAAPQQPAHRIAPPQPRPAVPPERQAQRPRPAATSPSPATPPRQPAAVQRAPLHMPATQPSRETPPPAASEHPGSIDDALLRELEVTFEVPPPQAGSHKELSLDDEMTKLLGELSSKKR